MDISSRYATLTLISLMNYLYTTIIAGHILTLSLFFTLFFKFFYLTHKNIFFLFPKKFLTKIFKIFFNFSLFIFSKKNILITKINIFYVMSLHLSQLQKFNLFFYLKLLFSKYCL